MTSRPDKDTRTYIRLHDGMPDHPKIDDLSDAAFRLLVRVWCRCSQYQTDGVIRAKWWAKQKASARRELIGEGLIEEMADGDVYAHDYLEHQRSAAEIAASRGTKSSSGSLGNHTRWHVNENKSDPDCPICVAEASQPRSHVRSQTGSQIVA